MAKQQFCQYHDMSHIRQLPANIFIETAQSPRELEKHLGNWQSLSIQALDANIFYEPAPFLTAINSFAQDWNYLCLFIYKKHHNNNVLIGFLPLLAETAKRSNSYRTFTHLHCYLSTPLVHSAFAEEAIGAMLYWLDYTCDRQQLSLYRLQSDGEFFKRLKGHLHGRMHRIEQRYERALLSRPQDTNTYLEQQLPKHKRKEYQRLRRRLSEQGSLSIEYMQPGSDPERWAEQFMTLESSGWKGERGFAMANRVEHTDFFFEMIDTLAKNGQVVFLALQLDGQPVAMKCNLLDSSKRYGFAFKIAYDEHYSAYSPGVLLELENIDSLSKSPTIEWIDSCADPKHPMIDKLWKDRREISHILINRQTRASKLKMGWLKLLDSRKTKTGTGL